MKTRGYLEHMALIVADYAPHIAFFGEVLGMGINRIAGPEDAPSSVWLDGGLQLVRRDGFAGPEGRCLHLGLMVADLDAAIEGALAHGGVTLPAGRNWLRMPDGLEIELMQATGDAVEQARAIDPRATAGSLL
ncbi:VOC family protein [Frigidibacter sp. MR17.24]|uniref:VOC family protein n=1 Tax=Frigidibacter sp. MR17.24 TaxID=3127345 RepID=UPI003012B56F